METGGSMEKRGRTLEDEFFFRVDKQLAEQLRAKLAEEEQRSALARISGLTDEHALDALVAAKITTESLVALALVPMARVAWADGTLELREKQALLQAAAESYCPEGSVGYELLKSWLDDPPADSLFDAWQAYTRTLCTKLTPDAREKLRDQIVGRVRKIAKATGGILGIHKISSKEEAVLHEVEHVFQ